MAADRSAQPVDVLAVMDRMCEQASEGPHYGHCEAVAARAAVAELVEAVKTDRATRGYPAFGPDPVGAALARVQGGAA